MKRKQNLGMLFVAGLLLGGFTVHEATAVRPLLRRPSVTVTVDLERVLEGLNKRADDDAELQKLAMSYQAEDIAKKEEIANMEDSMSDLIDQRKLLDKEEEIALATLRRQAWLNFIGEKLDVEESLMLQDLFREIQKAAEEMSKTEGFDVVLLDDSSLQLAVIERDVRRVIQIKEQLRARNLLFASPVTDISDDLITRMNNAYATK
ncbi:MAG: OmpH family outer membrane protein [Phycisphaerales bacterium]|nr:OmpH family outer membrane protein [Phycisphaerales bacterium]